MATKTLSINVTGGQYPANYNWSSSCTGITYSNQSGVLASDGIVTTTITYDDNTCYQCHFYFTFNNMTTCFGMQNTKSIIQLTCGDLSARTSDSNAQIIIPELGVNSTITSLTDLSVNNITFQTYNVQVITNCTPLTGSISVNGVIQHGNGTFNFVTTTSYSDPNLTITVACT